MTRFLPALVGVALTNLESDDVVQPQLPLDSPDLGLLDTTLDSVADRFGKQTVTRASLLRTGDGIAVPLLPD